METAGPWLDPTWAYRQDVAGVVVVVVVAAAVGVVGDVDERTPSGSETGPSYAGGAHPATTGRAARWRAWAVS